MSADPFEARLDEAHRAVLALAPEGLLDFTDIETTRRRTDELLRAAAARQPDVPDVAIEDQMVPGAGDRPDLMIRFYTPAGVQRPAPALLYIHGGGYMLGQVFHFDAQCKHLAVEAGVVVASIDYRLAPEHPYPVPLEDCHAALDWLHRSAETQGVDPARIGVGGASAGAGLAAGLALLARDRGGPAIAFQFLEAPMLDHRTGAGSAQRIDHPKVWNSAANVLAWGAYLGASGSAPPAYASPAMVRDLADLPRAYLCVGAYALFVDEDMAYARALLHAGVEVEFHLYEMGFHGSARSLPSAPVSVRWRRDQAEALRRLACGAT